MQGPSTRTTPACVSASVGVQPPPPRGFAFRSDPVLLPLLPVVLLPALLPLLVGEARLASTDGRVGAARSTDGWRGDAVPTEVPRRV